MKRFAHRVYPVLIGIILFLSLLPTVFAGEEVSREQALMQLITSSLSTWHYSPPATNEEFSERAFSLYLKTLDYNKRFFTQADLEALEPYRLRLTDEIKYGDYEFFSICNNLWQERIREVQAYTGALLKQPLNLREDEELEVDAGKRAHPRDHQGLTELWRKIVKHQTLGAYLDLLLAEGAQEATTAEKFATIQQQPFQPQLEKQAREKVNKNLNLMFERLLQEKEDDRFATYLNVLTSSFDPHTNYLAPKVKEDFDIDMSGTLEGIGATLQSDGEYVKVFSIEPGGPSWRQGQLKAGDIIMKVAQGEEEPVDVANMPLDDAVRLIRGKKGTEVRLTVKKPDGQMVVISIIRDVVVFEGKFARSMVIEHGETGEKIGYITLPSFYHDYNNPQGRTSTGDVRKELEKLKQEGVDGVILDLRNNGGGALDDAVKMAGLFIESGPIVQIKEKSGKMRVLWDQDATVVYGGPLVVMINSLSASASEIVAAALQDYGRAVIVGSPSSHGKGTVQGMIDLDYFLDFFYPRATAYKPMGTLKVTIEKYYRINGGSTQYKGVNSDIVFPDPYAYLDISEQTLDYALPWDEVTPLSYQKWTQQAWNLEDLKNRSLRRIEANPNFAVVQKNIEQVKAQKKQSVQSLQLDKFIETQRMIQLEAELNELKPGETDFVYRTLDAPGTDPDREQVNQEWLEQLRSDVYLEETIWIISDLIEDNALAGAA